MIEKFKTFVLALLVITSLFQSYLLAYNKPDLNLINSPEYVPSELLGDSMTMEQLIQPKDLILHFGEARHTVLYPNEYFFTLIMGNLTNIQLTNIERVILTSDHLANMRDERVGFEVRFHTPVLVEWVQHLLGVESILELGMDVRFEEMLFMITENDQVETYLIAGDVYYRVQASNMSIRDVQNNVTFGQYRTLYTTTNHVYYKPVESIAVADQIELPYTYYSSDQLRNSLFVNPRSTLSNRQRDNTEFIMDGKRLLQIDHTQHWMTYSNPGSPLDSESYVEDHIRTALSFVNQNGGWSGEYRLFRVPESAEQSYGFIQYFRTLPILPDDQVKFGYIEVTMNDGAATGYERSLINPEWTRVTQTAYSLVGGEELDALLEKLPKTYDVTDLFPAYDAIIHDENIEFIPGWVVKLENGDFVFLE